MGNANKTVFFPESYSSQHGKPLMPLRGSYDMKCFNCGSAKVVYSSFEAYCTKCGVVLEEARDIGAY